MPQYCVNFPVVSIAIHGNVLKEFPKRIFPQKSRKFISDNFEGSKTYMALN
jgi:hypothetical protein